MNRKLVMAVLAFLVVVGGCYLHFRSSDMERFSQVKPGDLVVQGKLNLATRTNPRYCPEPSNLIKENELWRSVDGKWVSHTPSLARRVEKFNGAQWIGVQLGKIICLYVTDEEVAFPLALEQKYENLVIEPDTGGWSALVNNKYRMCKSASAADCLFFVEEEHQPEDVYSEIRYNRK